MGAASAAYADVVYPIEARRDRGSHPTLNDVRRLLAGINGPAHQLIRNDAFNILDRAVLARALPGQTRQAVFAAAVQGLRAAGPSKTSRAPARPTSWAISATGARSNRSCRCGATRTVSCA